MKLLLVDYDGVLLPTRAHLLPENWARIGRLASSGEYPRDERYPTQFDPLAVRLLNRLAELTDARLVVISNWRRVASREWIHAHMEKQGIDIARLHEHWFPLFEGISSSKRGDLEYWLLTHKSALEDVVIIDDDDIFEEWRHGKSPLSARHVRPNTDDGFLLRDYARCLELLGVEDPELVRRKPRVLARSPE